MQTPNLLPSNQNRPALAITRGVWKALFLREALSRLFTGRALWFWLIAEPVFHASYLIFIFTVMRVHSVGGVETGIWILVGLLAFFTFRRTAAQSKNGVGANHALFAYRQVKPVDPVLVRGVLEICTMAVVSTTLLSGMALLGHDALPADPLAVAAAFLGLWLLGMGFGLITSVVSEMLPELDRLINLAMTPMYFLSGVMFPPSSIPLPYREWLLLNPVVHGIEAVRLGFAPHYHAVSELSLSYLFSFSLILVFFGLALHKRFEWKMVAA
jgi:capsular polysaccharide transport system permease protein